MQQKRTKSRHFTLYFSLLSGIIIILLLIVYYLGHRRIHTDTIIFTDSRHPEEARIPFTLKDDLICFDGVIAGRKVPFTLDTGSYVSTVPEHWRIATKVNGLEFAFRDTGGNQVTAKQTLIPMIQFAGCDIKNCAALELAVPRTNNKNQHVNATDVARLGNSAFWDSVVTIDYSRRILTITPESNPLSSSVVAHRKGSASFSWDDGDAHNNSDGPMLYGKVMGRKILIVVDTGTGNIIALTPQFFSSLQSGKVKNSTPDRCFHATFLGGSVSEAEIPSVSIIVDSHSLNGASLTLNEPAIDTNNSSFGTASAVIGTNEFSEFLITLDYPRRIITFSPQT